MRTVLRKEVFLLLWVALCMSACASYPPKLPREAQTYHTPHFTIHAAANLQLVHFLAKNVEAFYDSMVPTFFPQGFPEGTPLTLYFLEAEDDWKTFVRKMRRGRRSQNMSNTYFPDLPAAVGYYEPFSASWSMLFHAIVQHLARLNHPQAPPWFIEGLATVLGERAQIAKGKAAIGRPNPERAHTLQDAIENDALVIDLHYLLDASHEAFPTWEFGPDSAWALCYWLHERGQLRAYLEYVETAGYGIEALAQFVDIPTAEINRAFLDFIRQRVYPQAELADAVSRAVRAGPIQQLDIQLALLENPFTEAARIELAKIQWLHPGLQSIEETLAPVLADPDNPYTFEATNMLGRVYAKRNEHEEAIDYYLQALKSGSYTEESVAVYYHLAVSYAQLGQDVKARKWARKFLEENWHPEHYQAWVQEMQEMVETATPQ